MTNIKYFLLIPILLLLSNCAGVKIPSPDQMAKELEGFSLPLEPSNEQGVVYVVRPSIGAPAVLFYLHVNSKDNRVGHNAIKKYIYFPLQPGVHKIFSKAENWAELELEIKPNQVVFLEQSPKMGILYARNEIKEINSLVGKYHVKNLKLGTLDIEISQPSDSEGFSQEFDNSNNIPLEKIELRPEPKKVLLMSNIDNFVKKYNFFESSINPSGSYRGNFSIFNEDVIIDNKSGLCWQKSSSERAFLRTSAKKYVVKMNNKNYGGYSDWRLPTLEEMASLLQKKRSKSRYHIHSHFTKTRPKYWTADSPDLLFHKTDEETAWIVDFKKGEIAKAAWISTVFSPQYENQYKINEKNYVKIVRTCN